MATWKEVKKEDDRFRNRYFTHFSGKYLLRDGSWNLIYPQGTTIVNADDEIETEDIPLNAMVIPDGQGGDDEWHVLNAITLHIATTSGVGAILPKTEFKAVRLDAGEWTQNSSDATVHDLLDVWDHYFVPNQNMIQEYQGIGTTNAGGDLTNSTFADGDILYFLVKPAHATVGTTRYYNISLTFEWFHYDLLT